MLAKGCFAVCSTHPPDEGRPSLDAMLGRMRSFCDADEILHTLASPDGRCLVGSIAGKGQERWVTLGSDAARGAVGAFDGWTYTDSVLSAHPERLGESGINLRTHANGMFTALAYHDARTGTDALQRADDRRPAPGSALHFLTDPSGSTPL
jgi:hypothetical protein